MGAESLRVGIIGAGGNTRNKHIPGLQAIDGVEVVSVCNRTIASGKKVAEEFGIPKVCRHWTDVIEDLDVDAVVIGTWPYLHCAATCAALHAGKHVMVEARMAMNAAEAHEMLDTSQIYPDLIAQIVPSPFTFAWDKTINQLIADGYVGEIYAVDLRGFGKGFADLDGAMSWRQDIDMSGLNTMGMGIWYEAMARWVGHAKKVVAMRKVCVKTRPHVDGGCRAIRVPDHVDVIAELDCGAQANMRFSSVTGLSTGEMGATIHGSEGTLHLDIPSKTLLGGKRGDSALTEIPIKNDDRGEWRVEEEFVNAIRGKEKLLLTNFTEGVKYMEFTEAVARSAESGQVISLPLYE